MDTAGDVGTSKTELGKMYPQLNFGLVGRDKWWNTKDPNSESRFEKELKKEGKADLRTRFALLMLLVAFDKAKCICLVAHSKYYKSLSNALISFGISNAELKPIPSNTAVRILKEFYGVK